MMAVPQSLSPVSHHLLEKISERWIKTRSICDYSRLELFLWSTAVNAYDFLSFSSKNLDFWINNLKVQILRKQRSLYNSLSFQGLLDMWPQLWDHFFQELGEYGPDAEGKVLVLWRRSPDRFLVFVVVIRPSLNTQSLSLSTSPLTNCGWRKSINGEVDKEMEEFGHLSKEI